MMMPGPLEMAVIAGAALLIFGPKKLPQLGKSVGSAMKEFRSAVKNVSDEFETTGEEVKGSVKLPEKVV